MRHPGKADITWVRQIDITWMRQISVTSGGSGFELACQSWHGNRGRLRKGDFLGGFGVMAALQLGCGHSTAAPTGWSAELLNGCASLAVVSPSIGVSAAMDSA